MLNSIICHICLKDAHCVESNENSISLFLFFKLWLIIFSIYWWHIWIFKCLNDQKNRSKVAKFTGIMRNELKRMKNFVF